MRRRLRGAACTRKPTTSSSPARARPVARWPRGCRNRAATGCCCSRPAGATTIRGSTFPSAITSSTRTRGYNWKFESEPVAGLNNRTSYQPRGKMLGGTSSLNGMVYMRGTPADYDGWRQRGCEGWDYASVLPYFRKAENQERGESEFHGVGGPLNVTDQPLRQRARRRHRRAACVEAGIPRNPDFNGASSGGRRPLPGDGLRQAGAGARRSPISSRRASAAEPRGHAQRARDPHPDRGRPRRRRRVSHAARPRDGARPRRGDRLGRRLRLAAAPAAVGHRAGRASAGDGRPRACATCRPSAPTCTTISIPMSPSAAPRRSRSTISTCSPLKQARRRHPVCLWSRRARSPATALYAGAFTRSDPRFDRPDLQMNIFLWSIEKRDAQRRSMPHKFPGFSLSPVHLRPRGARQRAPQEPRSAWRRRDIRFEFLSSAYDIDAMLYGMRLARKIASQPALAALRRRGGAAGPASRRATRR